MLHVTSRARNELHGMLMRVLAERPDADEQLGFRVVPGQGSALGLTLDSAGPQDAVVEQGGRSVLILDAVTSDLLGGLTLDVVETPEGLRLGLVG